MSHIDRSRVRAELKGHRLIWREMTVGLNLNDRHLMCILPDLLPDLNRRIIFGVVLQTERPRNEADLLLARVVDRVLDRIGARDAAGTIATGRCRNRCRRLGNGNYGGHPDFRAIYRVRVPAGSEPAGTFSF